MATALGNGLQQRITNAISTLQGPATYQITPIMDKPSLTGIIEMGYVAGCLDTPNPTLAEALEGFVEFFRMFTAM